jgi:hypothetical protein
MEEKNKLPETMAQEEFERILKVARCTWSKYVRRNETEAENDKEDIIEAIMSGQITVNDDGYPTVTFDSEILPKLFFKRRIIGKDISAASKTKDEARSFYFAAAQYFGCSPTEIESLETGDIALLKALWMIFLRM